MELLDYEKKHIDFLRNNAHECCLFLKRNEKFPFFVDNSYCNKIERPFDKTKIIEMFKEYLYIEKSILPAAVCSGFFYNIVAVFYTNATFCKIPECAYPPT